jgi:hypothetical protein
VVRHVKQEAPVGLLYDHSNISEKGLKQSVMLPITVRPRRVGDVEMRKEEKRR